MSIPVVINNTTYQVPVLGDAPPNWGPDLTDIILALADGLTATIGPNDILPSTFTVSNNVTTPTPIAGLVFDQAQVRSAAITYSIDRTTSTGEVTENGTLLVNYNNTSNSWQSSLVCNGNSNVNLTITGGQVFYTSSNMSGSNYSSKMGFRALAFGQ